MKWQPGERTRKFAREIGSIVLGVLIALGLGAVATEIGWRHDVAAARIRLRSELGEAVGQARVRVAVYACVDRRLDALSALLVAADRTGRLPPVGLVGGTPWFTWTTGAYQSAMNSDTMAHFPREEQAGYAAAHEFIAVLDTTNREELSPWTILGGIAGPGRPIGEDERARLHEAVRRARLANSLLALSSVRFAQVVELYRLGFSRAAAEQYGEGYARASVRRSGICQPLSSIPGPRDSAPLNNAVRHALATSVGKL